MSTIRFIHAADLHLDSPFRGIRSEAPAHVAHALETGPESPFWEEGFGQ